MSELDELDIHGCEHNAVS